MNGFAGNDRRIAAIENVIAAGCDAMTFIAASLNITGGAIAVPTTATKAAQHA